MCEDREAFDCACGRSFVCAAEPGSVGRVDHDRLSEHREVAVAGAVDVGLADECAIGCGDATGEEGSSIHVLGQREPREHQQDGDEDAAAMQ